MKNQGCALNILHFGPVLCEAIEKGIKKPSIINGFRAYGLHPFDANAVDYSKCIAKTAAAFKVEQSEVDDSCEALHTSIMEPNSTAIQEDSGEENVTISLERIIEAYDLISVDMRSKIEGYVNLLSREERVIRFFYREFVRPHVVFDQQRSPMNSFETNSTDIDVSKCETVHIQDTEMLPNILPLDEYLFDEPRTGNIML